METKTEERPHHPFSPSKLSFLEFCPCYESKHSENERCIAGTRAHAVTETGEDDHRLDDDDAAAAAECMDFFENKKQELVQDRREFVHLVSLKAWGESGRKEDVQEIFKILDGEVSQIIEMTETYLEVDDLQFTAPVFNLAKSGAFKDVFDPQIIKSTTGGYIDRGLIDHTGKHAQIFDWKFGMWPVDNAKDNLQGIGYVLGMFKLYPALETVTMWFKQPHLGEVTSHKFSREDVPLLYLRVRRVVERKVASNTYGDFRMANPGVPNCNFCARIGTCTKVAEFVIPTCRKFHPLAFPDEITPTMSQDPAQTSLALRLAQVAAIWADSFKRQVTDRVLRGDATCPADYVIASRKEKTVADPKAMRAVALEFMTKDELDTITDFSRTAAAEIIKDKAPRGQKTAMVEEFQQRLLSSGALVEGQPYSFLRVASKKKEAATD